MLNVSACIEELKDLPNDQVRAVHAKLVGMDDTNAWIARKLIREDKRSAFHADDPKHLSLEARDLEALRQQSLQAPSTFPKGTKHLYPRRRARG